MATSSELVAMLEAGVHFGHRTERWNPKMRRYIDSAREGIYIIDILKTADLMKEAAEFAHNIARKGGKILFVSTKKVGREAILEVCNETGMPHVTQRWLGGLLTNFDTIKHRVARLHELTQLAQEGKLDLLPTRERLAAEADLKKLQANLGGVGDMERPPDASRGGRSPFGHARVTRLPP